MFRKLCGDTASKNVVLVTNMWGEVSRDIGEAREEELSSNFFKPALKLGARMVRHHNTIQSAHSIIRMIAANRPVVLRIQRELVDKRKDIVDTTAGKVINRELNEQIRRHQAELKEVQEEMEQAMKGKDEETRQELEEETKRLRERMEEIAKDSEGMTANYAVEKERTEARMQEVEQEVERRGQDEANRPRHLQDETNVSVLDRARLKRRDLVDIPVTTSVNTSPPTRETECTDGSSHPFHSTPHALSPQMLSPGTPYVQAHLHLANCHR